MKPRSGRGSRRTCVSPLVAGGGGAQPPGAPRRGPAGAPPGEADVAMASLENELALAYLAIGNLGRAEELATSAEQEFTRLDDERSLAHVLETRAAIALARNDLQASATLVARGLELARRTSNRKAELSNLLRRAKVQIALGDQDGALASYEETPEGARAGPGPPALSSGPPLWGG